MTRCLSPIRFGALVLGFVAIVGCGKKDADAPDTVPVSGKVTAEGQPVTEGFITFVPYDKDQKTGGTPSGKIDSTGGYVLFTSGKEGAPPGRYKVTVSPSMVPTQGAKSQSMPFNIKFTDPSKTSVVITVKANAAPGDYDVKLTK